MKVLLGLLGGVVFFVSFYPYVRDVYRGKTKPNLVTWFTWTLIMIIMTIVEVAEKEYNTAILTFLASLASLSIIVLGFEQGSRRYTKFDIACQILAVLGIIAWQIIDDAGLAVLFALSADLIAAAPTFRHAWVKPYEETWTAFALSVPGGVLTILSLEYYNFVSLGFPLYVIILDSCIAAVILFRLSAVK